MSPSDLITYILYMKTNPWRFECMFTKTKSTTLWLRNCVGLEVEMQPQRSVHRRRPPLLCDGRLASAWHMRCRAGICACGHHGRAFASVTPPRLSGPFAYSVRHIDSMSAASTAPSAPPSAALTPCLPRRLRPERPPLHSADSVSAAPQRASVRRVEHDSAAPTSPRATPSIAPTPCPLRRLRLSPPRRA